MKLAFSTLGCPDWELREIVAAARNWGYDGVELRAVGGSLDLLGRAEFAPAQLATTRAYFEDAGIEICCVDTSCAFHSADENERANQVKIALGHADLAARLGASLIRVFPDTIQAAAERAETRDWIVASLRDVAERLPDGVNVALETHGDFARAEYAAEIVTLANHPQVKLIGTLRTRLPRVTTFNTRREWFNHTWPMFTFATRGQLPDWNIGFRCWRALAACHSRRLSQRSES